ncbi:MAG: hypothetical protein ACTHXC_00280 [Brachybacterium sp.]
MVTLKDLLGLQERDLVCIAWLEDHEWDDANENDLGIAPAILPLGYLNGDLTCACCGNDYSSAAERGALTYPDTNLGLLKGWIDRLGDITTTIYDLTQAGRTPNRADIYRLQVTSSRVATLLHHRNTDDRLYREL